MFDLAAFRQTIQNETYEWRKHVLQRMAERAIRQRDVLETLQNGEVIHWYQDDKPFSSALFLHFVDNRPLHVLAAFDEANKWSYIITAYEPSLEVFEADFKTRKKL